jgi:hypothetical protein
MAMRNNIHFFMILLLLGAQLALAQHASVHFTDHGHETHHEHEEAEDERYADELCQICIFSKGLTSGLPLDGSYVTTLLARTSYKVPFAQNYITQQASSGYLARGPPSFLI